MNSFTEQQLSTLRDTVARHFADADRAHDIDHLHRVERMAARLARVEGLDETLARAAALVHDYHRLDGAHGLETSGAGGAHHVREVLAGCGAAAEAIERVEECVNYTDQYAMSGDTLAAPSREAEVVRDADNLDAMGAIGIARAFAFGATIDEPMWNPAAAIRDHYDRGRAPSVIHHFHEKLLNLRHELTTPTAKAIGEARHEQLQQFVTTFCAEWDAADNIPV
ncbi:HD domain-containing protein [Nocardia sp. 004]|uniref:HD domain-containing protein n=1 Tax=Nocardia sp. 004 TaxID=3385978 RepID=UPI0039A02E88